MSKTIKNLAQIQQSLDRQCYYAAEKTAQEVKEKVFDFIKDYYREYSPKYYERTWRLLNSIVKSEPKKIKNGYEVEVYIDTSIQYPSMWGDEHWNMGNTMYMANQGQHGRFNGGYPHLWDETYSNITYMYDNLADYLTNKGIRITVK